MIDPKRNGDDRVIQKPKRDDRGRPVTQEPLRTPEGRYIPPQQNNITIINNTTIVNNINVTQNNWRRDDHGYYWHDWDGRRVVHHYDEYGYHDWGFYVGSVYFWTRYHDERYWWYDPYWHRWCYLHDDQWWWQDGDRVIYVYTPSGYYRYHDDDSGVIMTPDPTPPVVVPPGEPATPAPVGDVAVYSLDGTRSIKITGDNRDAYLYDLTVADPQDPKAQPRWLAGGVTKAVFVTGADGALQQINVSFADATETVTVDVNGERKVDVYGDSQSAYLYNLADPSVDPVLLANGVTGVQLTNGQTTDDAGNLTATLSLITVTSDDGQGNVSTLLFDRDGLSVDGTQPPADGTPQPPDAAPQPAGDAGAPAAPISLRPAADSTQSLQERMQKNAALKALQSGSMSW